MTQVSPAYCFYKNYLSESTNLNTFMPTPRLVFSPGLHIHTESFLERISLKAGLEDILALQIRLYVSGKY